MAGVVASLLATSDGRQRAAENLQAACLTPSAPSKRNADRRYKEWPFPDPPSTR